jgi:hypothetical protein
VEDLEPFFLSLADRTHQGWLLAGAQISTDLAAPHPYARPLRLRLPLFLLRGAHLRVRPSLRDRPHFL